MKTLDKWTVKINDGYCEYEYVLKARNDEVSIHDLYELIRAKLEADKVEGRFVGPKIDP